MSRPNRTLPEVSALSQGEGVNLLALDGARSVPKSFIYFDEVNRIVARGGYSPYEVEIEADEEMAWVALRRDNHKFPESAYNQTGLCSEMDLSGLDTNADLFLVLFVLANGDAIPAAARTILSSFGMWRTGMDARDVVSFAGSNGMAPGMAFERISRESYHVASVHLIGDQVVGGGPVGDYAYGEPTGYWKQLMLMGG